MTIAGIISTDGQAAEKSIVKSMLAAQSALPAAIAVVENATLGQTAAIAVGRLTDGNRNLHIVMDGRIDNRDDLDIEFKQRGCRPRAMSDAVVVLHAYRAWGPNFLDHIDGDFALAIFDSVSRRLVCARDHFGKRPFVYHVSKERFSFASTPRALLALPWVGRKLNTGKVAELLAGEICTLDESLWMGIRRLPPACVLNFAGKGAEVRRCWQIPAGESPPAATDGELVECYRGLLFATVQRLSASNMPVAVEVSGGLDSSSIYAVAHRLQRQSELPAPGLRPYTLDIDPGSAANDLPFARAVAQFLGTAITEVEPSNQSIDWYRSLARNIADFPGYPNGIAGLGIRERARAEGCRVLLSGIGGDEILSGDGHRLAEAIRRFRVRAAWRELRIEAQLGGSWLPTLLRSGIMPLLPESKRRLARRAWHLIGHKGFDRRAWLRPELQHLLNQRAKQAELTQPLVYPGATLAAREMMEKVTLPNLAFTLELEHELAASRGIEVRYPFLSRGMVEFMLSVPDRLISGPGMDRGLHRAAMRGLLPDNVVDRTSKADFSCTFTQGIAAIARRAGRTPPAPGADWVEPAAYRELLRMAHGEEQGSWPAAMLWSLWGCAALATLQSQ